MGLLRDLVDDNGTNLKFDKEEEEAGGGEGASSDIFKIVQETR